MNQMSQMNTIIIVSHYSKSRPKKDIKWVAKFTKLGFHTLIYDHISSNVSSLYSVPENKGREASVYLKYMIDFYDSLQMYSAFIQDDEESWHHKGSIVKLVKDLVGTDIKYKNMNNRCLSTIEPNNLYPMMVNYFNKCLKSYIGPIEKYGDWTAGYKCCAQFIVHRDLIHKYPKKMYENMYRYMMDEKHNEKAKGHMFEWTLHLLFDNPYLMHKMSEKEFKTIMTDRKKTIDEAKDNKENVEFDGCRLIVDY